MLKEVKQQAAITLPAIIIIAHDRDLSLKRLLSSLSNAFFSFTNIPLIISIDHSTNDKVHALAADFEWKHGSKKIIRHESQLGLKEHLLCCGDLLNELEVGIFLEDDITVGPHFYSYALKAFHFYQKMPSIAGISLYSYATAESSFLPFHANDDGFDNYFIQVASSWGQLFTKEQWSQFKAWSNSAKTELKGSPSYLKEWGTNSWKKAFIKYMIDQSLYFVFPRKSHTSNFEDRGTNASSSGLFQVEIQPYDKHYRFSTIQESLSVYDASFEIEASVLKKLNPSLEKFNFSVNLYGTKSSDQLSEYVLTLQNTNHVIQSFGAGLYPLIHNVIQNRAGNSIKLAKSESIIDSKVNYEPFFEPSARKLFQEINPKKQGEQIGLIIPLSSWSKKELFQVLQSIENQSYPLWKCFLITDELTAESLEQFLRQNQFSKQFEVRISKQSDPMARVEEGLNAMETDILCWTPPIKLDKDHLLHVSSIFSQFRNIRWLKCLNDKDQIINQRWNYSIVSTVKKVDPNWSTSMMFFAKHIWRSSNGFSTQSEAKWIKNRLGSYPFYLFIDSSILPVAKKKSLKLVSPDPVSLLFKWFYQKNIPYLRSFYALYHNLHDLIRFDHKHRSYYLDRY